MGIGAAVLGAVLWFVGIPCIFQQMTGLYCPGCGATRAVKALAHGDALLALHDNAWLLLFAGPSLGLAASTSLWKVSDRYRERVRRYLIVTGYAAGAFFILRNIPVSPFNLLAPVGQ